MTRRQRRTHHNLHNGRRKTIDFHHTRPQRVIQMMTQLSKVIAVRSAAAQHPINHRIPMLCRCHRLDHIARKGGMQITEKTHPASIISERGQKAVFRAPDRLDRPCDLLGIAIFIQQLKIIAIQLQSIVRVTSKHRVGLCSCGDKNGARSKRDFLATAAKAVIVIQLLFF